MTEKYDNIYKFDFGGLFKLEDSFIKNSDIIELKENIECGTQFLLADNLGVDCTSYREDISEDIYNVLKLSNTEDRCTFEIAETLRLDEKYVDLIKYIICNNDIAEYGCSPSCAWLTKKGQEFLNILNELFAIAESTVDLADKKNQVKAFYDKYYTEPE